MIAQTQKTLANPGSLQNALRSVIENNFGLGYPSLGFRKATLNRSHSEVLSVCEELIASARAGSAMEKAVTTYSGFLTLEDYVARWGTEWGFSAQAVEHAQASAEAFDKLVGYQRWATESEAHSG